MDKVSRNEAFDKYPEYKSGLIKFLCSMNIKDRSEKKK